MRSVPTQPFFADRASFLLMETSSWHFRSVSYCHEGCGTNPDTLWPHPKASSSPQQQGSREHHSSPALQPLKVCTEVFGWTESCLSTPLNMRLLGGGQAPKVRISARSSYHSLSKTQMGLPASLDPQLWALTFANRCPPVHVIVQTTLRSKR